MTTDELKDLFLSGHPGSTHECDRERFLRYAFAAARENRGFDRVSLEGAGVGEPLIGEYETVYSWVRTLVSMQGRGERL